VKGGKYRKDRVYVNLMAGKSKSLRLATVRGPVGGAAHHIDIEYLRKRRCTGWLKLANEVTTSTS